MNLAATPFSSSKNDFQIDIGQDIHTDNIVTGTFMPVPGPAPGMVDPDDLMAELMQDPEFAAEVPAAMNWVADTYYPGEISLKTIRLRQGLSQRELAKLIGTEQPYIAKLESGKGNPTIGTIEKIAVVLKTEAVEIFNALRKNQ